MKNKFSKLFLLISIFTISSVKQIEAALTRKAIFQAAQRALILAQPTKRSIITLKTNHSEKASFAKNLISEAKLTRLVILAGVGIGAIGTVYAQENSQEPIIQYLIAQERTKRVKEVLRTRDGSYQDLSECDFSGKDLSGVIFRGSNLTKADFEDADLTGADLVLANLTKVNLHNANLEKANLIFANLQEADCFETNFQRASLERVNFQKACLEFAKFQEANLSKANLTETDLRNANITDANFENAVYKDTKLTQEQIEMIFSKYTNVNSRLFNPKSINLKK